MTGGGEVKGGFDEGTGGAGADGSAAEFASKGGIEGVEDDGFAGPGFAGEYVEAGAELEF